ncbi:hypothetical protein DV495_003564 [Geotrichum candidum]|nr:hypothetical protein DV452_000381 [Geotrichum candidum]KAF5126446.1 hypothetical protein DV495_003564 [Geotrichum candidum]KAF7498280.1 hypothetical protein DV113_003670 [Geotrichum candidum]KAI8131990.1 hypothetical protein DUD61_004344 [Geotrichum candidum]KAI9214398.1 hypothetical protein DS838_000776 [Geotrichum bryndzae]
MINAARRPLATFLSKQTLTAASPRIAAQATATASFGWFGLGLRFNGTTAAQPVDEQIKDLIASNKSTVPNIFINGRHVGGNSDLQALHQKGELLDLVSGGDAAAPEVKAKL